jgi:hypothetical protein
MTGGTKLSRLIALSFFMALALAATASAATKPWQWTPAQAKAAIMLERESIYVDERGLPKDLLTVRCIGQGDRVAGRFTAFRCVATFEGPTLRDPAYRAVILAKTRRAGGLCFSITRIPYGCLVAGKRVRGSISSAYGAFRNTIRLSPMTSGCVANGAGFYSCWWTDAEGEHRATVVFAPRPIVHVFA